MPECNCIEILEAIEKHAKGKLCSRFLLGIERSITALELGSPKKALEEQDSWFDDLKQQAPKKLKKT